MYAIYFNTILNINNLPFTSTSFVMFFPKFYKIIASNFMRSCKLFTGGNRSIHFLDLSWNHIRLSGAVGLCKGLQRNTSIINMNLAWNGLAFQGSLAIEEMLKQNTCLKFFDVSNNRINWEGVSYVAKGLKRNGTLQMLKVKNDISGLRGYTLLKQRHSDHSEK